MTVAEAAVPGVGLATPTALRVAALISGVVDGLALGPGEGESCARETEDAQSNTAIPQKK